MIMYAPYLGQAPSDQLLTQIVKLQQEIGTAISQIPPGSVDQAKMAALKQKLAQCVALGPTADALKCFTDLRTDIQTASPAVTPSVPASAPALNWPLIAGGAVVLAGLAALLLSSK